MDPIEQHLESADASFDGGELDCGSGLLLLLRKNLDLLQPGQLLEVRSVEPSVEQDLPAWCRLTKNGLVSWTKHGKQRSFLIQKGSRQDAPEAPPTVLGTKNSGSAEPIFSTSSGAVEAVPTVEPYSVMGIGSWPRPRWLVQALHEFLEGRLPEAEFHETANDAVKLAIAAQLESGVDVITDGEQRRDNYSSFVGTRIENCQLIPLVDLLPLVEDPEDFEKKLHSLDVPADKVRHPAVFGKIRRTRPLAGHELDYARSLTDKPVKIALPGPYLLTRTMWMECIADKAYQSREELAGDIVAILREELKDLLERGAAIVQFDEPVLTEVVYAKAHAGTTFMCGALSEKSAPSAELSFARDLINAVLTGFPSERTALHVCRGNWTPDESAALVGDYEPLLPVLNNVGAGTLFLEYCTPRAGDLALLSRLPSSARIGLGLVNPKAKSVETVADILKQVEAAERYIGADRLLLNPDCGFATFADNPITSAEVASAKLKALVQAASALRSRRS